MFFRSRRVRTLQPAHFTSVDTTDYFGRDLFAAYNFGAMQGTYFRNSAPWRSGGGQFDTITAAGSTAKMARVDTTGGRAVQLTESGVNYLASADIPPNIYTKIKTAWTYLLVFDPGTMTDPDNGSLIQTAESPGSSTRDRSIWTTHASSKTICHAHVFDGANKVVDGTTDIPNRGPACVVATCTSSLLTLYLNGKSEGSIAVSNAGYNLYTTAQLMFGYGSNVGATTGSIMKLILALCFVRALTTQEVAYISQRDAYWRVFQRRKVGILQSASSAVPYAAIQLGSVFHGGAMVL